MNPDTFRAAFPEFADPLAYPDAQVSLWMTLAQNALPALLWDDLWTVGVYLYTAHNLALAALAGRRGATGSGGIVSSKSVGGVSVSYDTGSATVTDGGAWNLTNYGTRYLAMARTIGAGGVQL